MAYYTATGNPGTQTSGRSATTREEFLLIQTGFGQASNDIQALATAVGIGVTTTENDIASATTTDIGNGLGNVLRITGTNAINSFGANYTGAKQLRFSGILTLLNNPALLLPGGANITTEAGDVCIAVPIGNPATGWRVLAYCRMSKALLDDDAVRKSDAGAQVVAGTIQSAGFIGNLQGNVSGTATNVTGTVGIANGGTGATTAATARGALAAAKSGDNSDITSLAILPGYQFGCQLSTPGSSTTINISAGRWTDSTGVQLISLADAIAKTVSPWAVGTGNGGKFQAGAIANNATYHHYLVRRPDTGVVDEGFSTNPNGLAADDYVDGGGNLPAAYTQFRLIGSWTTNGAGQWTSIIQDGDTFMLATPVLDGNTGTPGAAAFSVSLPSLPAGRRLKAIVCVSIVDTAGTDAAYISDLSTADLAPSGTAAPGITVRSYVANNTGVDTVQVMTSTGRLIRARVQTGADTCTIRFITLGWIDTRGRDA